jgi:hypothetical protein
MKPVATLTSALTGQFLCSIEQKSLAPVRHLKQGWLIDPHGFRLGFWIVEPKHLGCPAAAG